MPRYRASSRFIGVRRIPPSLPFADVLLAGSATHAWDFITNRSRFSGKDRGPLSATPNWTFTRASTGYAQTSGGVLVPFASGELRRTDKGVLIEGAGTNLCLQSQTFDNASWTKTRSSISADATTAPDGTVTADKLVEDSSSNTHWTISNIITITADSTFTVSAYFKAGERTWVRLIGSDNTETNLFGAFFDIANGVLGTDQLVGTGAISSKSITPLANGWYRCAVTGSIGSGITSGRLQIKLGLADLTVAYAGNGTSGLYLWGAQLEAKAYASSYIPTTTASATRAADTLKITGMSGVDHPLSLYCEIERVVDTGATEGLIATYLDGSNFAELFVSSGDKATCATTGGGSKASAASVGVGSTAKIAGRCATNDVNVALGGTAAAADTTATMPTAPNQIWFGEEIGTGVTSRPFCYIRRAAIWPRALTDAELQSLST